MVRRSSVARTKAPCTCFDRVTALTAASAAPLSAAAAIVLAINVALANGRAASCTTTTSARSDTTWKAAATESCRRAPPATMRSGFAVFARYASAEQIGRQRDHHSSTSGCARESTGYARASGDRRSPAAAWVARGRAADRVAGRKEAETNTGKRELYRAHDSNRDGRVSADGDRKRGGSGHAAIAAPEPARRRPALDARD